MKILHSKGAYEGHGKRVFIAMPSYSLVTAEVLYSLFGAKEALLRNGIESELEIVTENCHVDDGRNFCVRDFLESKCTDLVFIDADIRFDPEDIVRLVMYSPDVVAGIYPKKQGVEEYPVRFLGDELWTNSEGLMEVEGVPTGFLKISRYVLEAIDKIVPHYLAQNDILTRRKIPLIFERTLRGHSRLGGDYEFCRKWRKLNGKIYIDPEMSFGHNGTFEWKGTLGHYLRKLNGLTDRYILSQIDKIKQKVEQPRDLNALWDAWGNEWTPPAEMLSAIIMLMRDGDGPILECGSGLTTLILGISGRDVTSLEHDELWRAKLAVYLKKASMDNVHLGLCAIWDEWYNFKPKSNEKYSMVVIDGPPRGIGKRAGIVNRVKNLTDDCIFVIDDVGTDLDVCKRLDEAYNVKFNYFGRYAIGKRIKS